MKVQICTPTKRVTLNDITYIHLPAKSGVMGVLDNHAPMIVTLKKGIIVFEPHGKLEIPGGTAFIQPTETTIMTDAEVPNDL
jgi:F-type H+-transporting ATPase subunit epsilon